jgi:4-amino-4-deoxy-L-arabinose transferase-like glycosyltransferase
VETFLLLALIFLVTATFIWLRRQIGDEWPPVVETEPLPAAQMSANPAVVSPRALPVEEAPLPEFIAPAVLAPLPLSDVAAAEPPVSAPPLPRRAALPIIAPSGPAARRAAWALAVGGGLLLLLAQLTSRVLEPSGRLPVFLLTLFGGLALLVGFQSFRRDAMPGWVGRPLARLAAFLHVTPAQSVLLLLAPAFAWLTRLAAGDGLLARQATVAVLAWLLAIGFVVTGSAAREDGRPQAADSRPPFDRWDVGLSALFFVVALALRAYQTTQFPNTYSGDEGSAGLYAIELLTGKATNLFGLGWFSFPSLYFTVQSAAIAIAGRTIEAVRFTSAVAGAATVVALYWLARAMFDRTTAILAALYLAASHYHIHMSRIALNNVWDGLFGTLAILGLWHGWQTGRRAGFILCGLALGLGQYFYVSIRPLPILFLIWAAVAFWRQRALFRERFHGLVLAALIAFVVFLPLGLYFLDHTDEFQAPMNRVTIFGPWLEGELARGERTTAQIILDQTVKGALGFTHEPLRLLYNPGSPLLLTGAGLLFLLGVLWAFLNPDLRYLLLLLPLLAAIASNSISQDAPASQRYIMAMPMVALFVALPVGQAVGWLRAQYPRYRTAIVVAAVAMLTLVAAVDLNYYFNRVYDTYVLGDMNTKVATEIAYFLRDKEPAEQDVFFFGLPRMGYFSLSTIPFLAPEKTGLDIVEPLTGPQSFPIRGPSLFIFLPERLGELEYVRQQHPHGSYREFRSDSGELLFAVYEV